jgi:hypothetical protein
MTDAIGIDLSGIENKELISEPGKLHENGWQRVSLWQQVNGGMWGDDALAGFTSYYEKPGTDWKGEISYYVEQTQTFNQPEVVDTFVVECHCEVFRDVDNDQHDLEMTTDYGSVLYYDSFDSAMQEARRLAGDESYIFNV